MPRRPTRHCRFLRSQPFTFAPFSRSLALMNSGYNQIKRNKSSSKIHRDKSPISGNGNINHNGEVKTENTDSSDEEEFEGVVQADFAFFDPKPDDFHGVKLLLQTYLDDTEWDLSSFVELILGQTTVGTVVKIENDDENGVFAVATALNMARYKDQKCMVELKNFVIKACDDKSTQDKLILLLEKQSAGVALLVSQRMVNLPPQLLPPLYDSLFDEVSWATEDEPTEELRNSFCFNVYLIVTKIYKHKNIGQRKVGSSSTDEDIIYYKPEDEIFHKLSLWSYTFPLRTQQLSPHELKQYRLTGLVIAVEATKVSAFREQLKSLIDES